MSAANKALVRRIFDEVWNQGNLQVLDEVLDPNYKGEYPSGPTMTSAEQLKRYIAATRAAFPDLRWAVEDLIAEGDKVVARWTNRGTHQGEWRGIAATGKPVTMSGVSIFRIVNGKIRERWGNTDALGVMRQLGTIPQ